MDFTANANLAIIRERWPAISTLVDAAKIPQSTVVVDSGPENTMVVEGLHLSSSYDRQKEARLQASLIPVESELGWVYGFGLGDLPRALLLRDSLKTLNVVLMNPAVVRGSCQYFDHADWLSDPRVNLLTSDGFDAVQFPFAAVPPCLQLANDGAARLRDLVVLELATPFINGRHAAQHDEMVVRLDENLTFVQEDGDVAELFQSQIGRTILVAAAGPTLADCYGWLCDHRSEYCLVAVDAALSPLLTEGILPDIVVSMDSLSAGVVPLFSKTDLSPLKDKFLVYFPTVSSEVLDLWPGKRLTAYVNQPLYGELATRYSKSCLFSSGSVIHPAVDLAVKMGAARVVLLGADFSFVGGNSHAPGSPAHREQFEPAQGCWVLNGFGERVGSKPNLVGYLRDLERYIATKPNVQFVDGSKKGAHIVGTSCLEDGF